MTVEMKTTPNHLVRLATILGDPKTGRLGLLPISRSHFYRLIDEHKLPAPIRLGPRTSAWRLSDIEAFIERLAAGDPHTRSASASSKAGEA
jgi:prophage regulatory protein